MNTTRESPVQASCLVVIASGYITTRQMARAGLALDLLGAVLVTLFVYLLGRPIFGIP